jgi:hypothetical protein
VLDTADIVREAMFQQLGSRRASESLLSFQQSYRGAFFAAPDVTQLEIELPGVRDGRVAFFERFESPLPNSVLYVLEQHRMAIKSLYANYVSIGAHENIHAYRAANVALPHGPEKSTRFVTRCFMTSDDIANAVLEYLRETIPEYSQGKCGLSLVPKLTPDRTTRIASMYCGFIRLLTPRDDQLFPTGR